MGALPFARIICLNWDSSDERIIGFDKTYGKVKNNPANPKILQIQIPTLLARITNPRHPRDKSEQEDISDKEIGYLLSFIN